MGKPKILQDIDSISEQLSEKANQSSLDATNANITNNTNAIALKANDTDSNRTTTDKTVTGAINELNTNKADETDLVVERARINNLVATSSTPFYQKCVSTDTGVY
jgi:hypothetical protein